MKKYTIEDASKGEVSAKNDGTVEQMQEFLRLAFPNDKVRFFPSQEIAGRKFFSASPNLAGRWFNSDETDLPTQSVKDFLKWKPVRGEMVMVRVTNELKWEPRIFLVEITGATTPFTTVSFGDEYKFKKGLIFDTARWTQMKQIETTASKPEENPNEMIKVTVTLNGENINPMQFSEKHWAKIRTNQ